MQDILLHLGAISYGLANLNWVKHLKRQGVDVSVNAKFTPFPGSDEWEVLDDEERAIFEKPFTKERVGIIETTPNNFHLLDTEVKICNTMAETDQLGEDWVNKINGMDYVIVPNKFYKRVFKSSGVTKPIKVIPHGVDSNRFSYKDRRKRKRDTYIFGSCGYLNDRKGVFELIQAFYSEFYLEENVELHLHSTDPELGWYKNIADPRIKITSELWDFEKLVNWYHDLDCFVFPSKAEGIGYPPREAMATGLPTILTNYSGLEDIVHLGIGLDPVKLVKKNPMKGQIGNWAEINVQDLMGAMRWAYENKEQALQMGRQASKEIEREWSWEQATKKLVEFLHEL